MSVESTAAIYGALAGAIVSGLFGFATLVLGRSMRRWGGIEFAPSNWRFAYLEWPIYEYALDERGNRVTSQVTYRFYAPVERHHDPSSATYAAYDFTAELVNRMEVGGSLRDVSVAFMKDGAQLFVHRPFDADNTHDPSGLVFELPVWTTRYLDLEYHPEPGAGMDPLGTIYLAPSEAKRIKLKGYVGGSDANYLKAGCDEVRLRATRENGKRFDEHIATLDTKPRRSDAGSGASVGFVGT